MRVVAAISCALIPGGVGYLLLDPFAGGAVAFAFAVTLAGISAVVFLWAFL
jgi:hypothetical protein